MDDLLSFRPLETVSIISFRVCGVSRCLIGHACATGILCLTMDSLQSIPASVRAIFGGMEITSFDWSEWKKPAVELPCLIKMLKIYDTEIIFGGLGWMCTKDCSSFRVDHVDSSRLLSE